MKFLEVEPPSSVFVLSTVVFRLNIPGVLALAQGLAVFVRINCSQPRVAFPKNDPLGSHCSKGEGSDRHLPKLLRVKTNNFTERRTQ